MSTSRRRAVYLSLGAPHLEFPGVATALDARGVDAELMHLDDVDKVDWTRVDFVNVRMARGYQKCPDFLLRVEQLHKRLQDVPHGPVPLANPIEIVRCGVHKGIYLRRLQSDGIATIPTRWVDRGSRLVVADLMDEEGWPEVAVKPLVSAGSWRTIRVSRSGGTSHPSHLVLGADDGEHQRQCNELFATHDACVQPFQPRILDEGELSFVFLGGRFSHAVRKTVGEGGRLLLLECELAIPRLLLPEGNAFGRYADAIVRNLDRELS